MSNGHADSFKSKLESFASNSSPIFNKVYQKVQNDDEYMSDKLSPPKHPVLLYIQF